MAAQQSQGHFAQGITIRTSDWGFDLGVDIDTSHNRRKIYVYVSNDESLQKQIFLIMLVSWQCPAKHGSCNFPEGVVSPYTE